MNKDRYIFSQIADFLPRRSLQVSQFEKTPLHSLISTTKLHFEENETKKQLKLAEF